jgi:enoyl-CoA hydratase/carnithine racemase
MSGPEAASEPVVLTERRGRVLLVTLNRPERLNAWTAEIEHLYYAALADGDADPEVRAIVVTGAGRGFCPGADLQALAGVDRSSRDSLPKRRWDAYPPTMATPVLAAVNGACAGIGLVVALQCDLRFVAAEARLATSFTRRGLIAEHGSSWLLPRLVGRSRALDLLMSARTFDGQEAERIGLAEFVLPREQVLDAALAYAEDLAANCSPTAVAVVKAQVQRHLGTDPETALRESDELLFRSFGWPDVTEGVTAWLQGRPADFPSADRSQADLDALEY